MTRVSVCWPSSGAGCTPTASACSSQITSRLLASSLSTVFPCSTFGGLQQDAASMELMMTVAETSVDDQVRSRVLGGRGRAIRSRSSN